MDDHSWALICTVTQARLSEMPSYRVSSDASFYDNCINHLDEANELINGSLNEMNCFASAISSSSTETCKTSEDLITAINS